MVCLWMVVLEMVSISFCSSEFSILFLSFLFFTITIYYFWNKNKPRVVLFVVWGYQVRKAKEGKVLREKY